MPTRQITKNFHTHTARCKHATGTVGDYVEAGIRNGVVEIGISDHTPLPDNRWDHMRMPMCELANYVDEIDCAQKHYSLIKILKAAECEYAPEYRSFYDEVLLQEYSFDYLIGGLHHAPYEGDWIVCGRLTPKSLPAFSKYFTESMESGLFAFMAHPDIFGFAGLPWNEDCIACSRDILQAAEELNIPLEINGYGLRRERIKTADGYRRPYPLPQFWALAQDYEIEVVCSSDAHQPQDIVGNILDSVRIAEENDLTFADTDLFHSQRYINEKPHPFAPRTRSACKIVRPASSTH